jgi:hypothetical protein
MKRRPKPKTDPRHVCLVPREYGVKMIGWIDISFRCRSRNHSHVPAAKARAMVRAGSCEWVGGHRKMIMWGVDKTWAKTLSGDPSDRQATGVMQLLPASRVAGRRGRKAQKLPKLSTQMGSNVAMWNDGRLK